MTGRPSRPRHWLALLCATAAWAAWAEVARLDDSASPQAQVRSANWTFSYANLASRTAGTYAGQVTFTASTP